MTLNEDVDLMTGDKVFTLRIPHTELKAVELALQQPELRLVATSLRNAPQLSAKLALLTTIAELFEQLEAKRKGQANVDEWFGGN